MVVSYRRCPKSNENDDEDPPAATNSTNHPTVVSEPIRNRSNSDNEERNQSNSETGIKKFESPVLHRKSSGGFESPSPHRPRERPREPQPSRSPSNLPSSPMSPDGELPLPVRKMSLPRMQRKFSIGDAIAVPPPPSPSSTTKFIQYAFLQRSHRRRRMSSESHDKTAVRRRSSCGSQFSATSDDSSDESCSGTSYPMEKLYGRNDEQAQLLHAYERIVSAEPPKVNKATLEFIIISGESGTGKTSLAQSLRPHVAQQGGYFCSVKFDQLSHPTIDHAMGPIITALTDLISQLLEEGTSEFRTRRALKQIQTQVHATDLDLLIQLIPPISTLLSDSRIPRTITNHALSSSRVYAADVPVNATNVPPPTTTTTTVPCSNLSFLAVQRFLRAICSPQQPLVILLDDLHWADPSTFQRLRPFIQDVKTGGLCFLATCRSDLSPPDSELSQFLRTLEDAGVVITNIGLSNLQQDAIHQLVQDKFQLSPERSNSLSGFVYKHSDGNALFVDEILYKLQRESKVLKYRKKDRRWSMAAGLNPTHMETKQQYQDDDQTSTAISTSTTIQDLNDSTIASSDGGVVDLLLVRRNFGALTKEEQKVLMVASCLGSRIDELLVKVALQEDVTTRLIKLVREGVLILDVHRAIYSFRHDRLQASAYELIQPELRPAFHLEVGRRLLKNLDDKTLHENLFVVLDQLHRGSELMTDPTLRYETATLCIRAAEQSALSSSLQTASEYLQFAFTLLGPGHWKNAYDLSLVLYKYAAEIEFSIGNHDQVDRLLNKIFAHARTFQDKIGAYSVQVYALSARGNLDAAIETGVHVLSKLGVTLPKTFNKINLRWRIAKVERRLRRRSDESIKRMKRMTESNIEAAMQMLNHLFSTAHLARLDIFPFVVMKMIKLTLSYGLSAFSSVAFAGFGTLLCTVGHIEEGLRYGQLSLDLLNEFQTISFVSRCFSLVYGRIYPLANGWRESLEPLTLGYRVGLQTGDIEFALLCGHLHLFFMQEIGAESLDVVYNHMSDLYEISEALGQWKQVRGTDWHNRSPFFGKTLVLCGMPRTTRVLVVQQRSSISLSPASCGKKVKSRSSQDKNLSRLSS